MAVSKLLKSLVLSVITLSAQRLILLALALKALKLPSPRRTIRLSILY
jgi:hypothetical protein